MYIQKRFDMSSIFLNCWVIGESQNNIISVEIRTSETIAILKDRIKEKKKPRFDSFAADELVLFKIVVPTSQFDKILKNAASPNDVPDAEKLGNTTIKISGCFDDPPTEYIHIMVQRPVQLPPTTTGKPTFSDFLDDTY
jgi:hypothetical protein